MKFFLQCFGGFCIGWFLSLAGYNYFDFKGIRHLILTIISNLLLIIIWIWFIEFINKDKDK